MNYYQKKKQQLRAEAIQYQIDNANNSLSWGDIVSAQDYFNTFARQYGLIREFKREGIL